MREGKLLLLSVEWMPMVYVLDPPGIRANLAIDNQRIQDYIPQFLCSNNPYEA